MLQPIQLVLRNSFSLSIPPPPPSTPYLSFGISASGNTGCKGLTILAKQMRRKQTTSTTLRPKQCRQVTHLRGRCETTVPKSDPRLSLQLLEENPIPERIFREQTN